MLALADLHIGGEGPPPPCVLSWTGVCSTGEARQVLLMPLLLREGGFLCALPADLQPEVVAETGAPLPTPLLGPCRLVTVPAIEEDEHGEEIPSGWDIQALLLDLEIGALASMRLFDPVTETGTVHSFVQESLHLIPQYAALLQQARLWIEQETTERLGFYSAQEEEVPPVPAKKASPKPKRVTVGQLSEQVSSLATLLPGLIDQMKSVIERQDRVEAGAALQPQPSPPVPKPPHQQSFVIPKGPGLPMPKVTALTGPPPRIPCSCAECYAGRTAPAKPGPFYSCGPPGVATRRWPGRPFVDPRVDKSECKRGRQKGEASSCAGQPLGGLLSSSDAGSFQKAESFSTLPGIIGRLVRSGVDVPLFRKVWGLWGSARSRLCHVVLGSHSRLSDPAKHTRSTGVFGAHLGGGRSERDRPRPLGLCLDLLEDPLAQQFHARPYSSNPRSRAFSPLSPVAWTTCALQYLKEIDLITTRRLESLGTGPKAATSRGSPPQRLRKSQRGSHGARENRRRIKFSSGVDSACSSACRASGLSAQHVRCPKASQRCARPPPGLQHKQCAS